MNYRYFTFLTGRDTIMWQGRERLSDAREFFGCGEKLPDAGRFWDAQKAFGCRERGLS